MTFSGNSTELEKSQCGNMVKRSLGKFIEKSQKYLRAVNIRENNIFVIQFCCKTSVVNIVLICQHASIPAIDGCFCKH